MVTDIVTPPGLFCKMKYQINYAYVLFCNLVDRKDDVMWRFYDNAGPASFCGRSDVILAGTIPGITTNIGTKDFVAKQDHIFQYTVR